MPIPPICLRQHIGKNQFCRLRIHLIDESKPCEKKIKQGVSKLIVEMPLFKKKKN